MTDKPTPTDAELKAMWQPHAADIGGLFHYARAVLAQWGSPVVAGEPYAYAVYFHDQPCEELVHDLDDLTEDLTNREHTITELYTTPQPTQTQAGAVTDAQVLAAVRVVSPGLFRHGLQPLPNDGANTAAQMRKEADTVRKMLEAAHGIKGGQHGTE